MCHWQPNPDDRCQPLKTVQLCWWNMNCIQWGRSSQKATQRQVDDIFTYFLIGHLVIYGSPLTHSSHVAGQWPRRGKGGGVSCKTADRIWCVNLLLRCIPLAWSSPFILLTLEEPQILISLRLLPIRRVFRSHWCMCHWPQRWGVSRFMWHYKGPNFIAVAMRILAAQGPEGTGLCD